MSLSDSKISVIRNCFEGELLSDLQEVAHAQPDRKRRFDLEACEPGVINHAGEFLAQLLGIKMNTAILKRYRVDDTKPSGAYVPHPDPDCFSGEKIALCSLDGEAVFFIEHELGVCEVECYANTLVAVDPDVQHWVTPPQNPEGVRHLLFYGLDNTKPATIDQR